MTAWIKTLFLPPMPFLALALAGLLAGRWRAGRGLAVLSLAALYVLAMPVAGSALLGRLEVYPPLADGQVRQSGAQAVVVLSAEGDDGPEYGFYSVGPMTLVRLRYAAHVQAASGLPLLVSGGVLARASMPIAEAMRRVLEQEFHVPVAWAEDRSLDTWENARESARILSAHGVTRVLLVTHAWHMRRAAEAFERAGLQVVAAPTGFTEPAQLSLETVVPSARALTASHYALYEMLGGLYYRLVRS